MLTRRKILAATGGVAGLAAARIAAAQAPAVTTQGRNEAMQITRAGSQASRPGPAEYFTGAVRVDPVFAVREPSRVSAGHVTFEPGARSAWTYPSARPDVDHHVGLGLGATRRRPDRRSAPRRCRLVSARPEALARRDADHCNDAHRHSGNPERQERRLDGKGQRRAIPQLSPREERGCET
jgi:hypothetical protein